MGVGARGSQMNIPARSVGLLDDQDVFDKASEFYHVSLSTFKMTPRATLHPYACLDLAYSHLGRPAGKRPDFQAKSGAAAKLYAKGVEDLVRTLKGLEGKARVQGCFNSVQSVCKSLGIVELEPFADDLLRLYEVREKVSRNESEAVPLAAVWCCLDLDTDLKRLQPASEPHFKVKAQVLKTTCASFKSHCKKEIEDLKGNRKFTKAVKDLLARLSSKGHVQEVEDGLEAVVEVETVPTEEMSLKRAKKHVCTYEICLDGMGDTWGPWSFVHFIQVICCNSKRLCRHLDLNIINLNTVHNSINLREAKTPRH